MPRLAIGALGLLAIGATLALLAGFERNGPAAAVPVMPCPAVGIVGLGKLTYATSNGMRIRRTSLMMLVAETPAGKLDLFAPQPDYGAVNHIDRTRSGLIAVLGDQQSFLFGLTLVDGKPALRSTQSVPMLFTHGCWLVSRLVGGCIYQPASYSQELKAIFASGDTLSGAHRLLVYGLSAEPHDLTGSRYTHFGGDLPGHGALLLGKEDGKIIKAMYNGDSEPLPCR